MAHIYVCFVWHMHQPFYKELATGEYQLPWTRMHALKDYYGMVKVLEDFPEVRQTFNLVPSMMVQVEEYAAGQARDPFLRAALKPAEELDDDERRFILKYFFQADVRRMIHRYRRYGELYELWKGNQGQPDRLLRLFTPQRLRDLQVLSQLVWFDEEIVATDAEVQALIRKGREYSTDDQAVMGRKQTEICGMVLPVYRDFAARGQIELSVTPFYHPILPLLCDSNIASVAHPNVPLPRRFRYPEDAREQIKRAREYMTMAFGKTPGGMWPSEGSVSDEVIRIAAETGVQWMATDNGVLGATLGHTAGVEETYRPYVWRQDGREMRMIFRDHFLSDLIGFVYSKMDAESAAAHFHDRIKENSEPMRARGHDVLVPVILDGENAWEYFEQNGRPFLRALYRRISEDATMSAVTVEEALSRVEPAELTRIHPGSWINANFDVWIGPEEDNKAWTLLLEAREAYERESARAPEERRRLAYEELLIAEGSDWCWWYGPEHQSDNRDEFDELFRGHVAGVYRALGLSAPEELSRPIVRERDVSFHEPPSGLIMPKIDGQVTSYFEWLGAGVYRPDERQGAMHGGRFLVRELRYGSDGTQVYLRLDLNNGSPETPTGLEIRTVVENSGRDVDIRARVTPGGVEASASGGGASAVQCALQNVFEMSVDLEALGMDCVAPVRFQMSLWRDGLPADALPAAGWIEFTPAPVA